MCEVVGRYEEYWGKVYAEKPIGKKEMSETKKLAHSQKGKLKRKCQK